MNDPVRNVCVLGTQWGDEGKGKIVDVLSEDFDVVVRFQGGANAGHTVRFDGTLYILHLLPSGILRPGKLAVLGSGMVIDPKGLVEEIDRLTEAGIDISGRLFISDRAHIVMPYHKILDEAAEKQAGAEKIGTTLRGIGPCYEDKAGRRGVRAAELVNPALLRRRLEHILPQKNAILQKVYGLQPLDLKHIWSELQAYGERLREAVVDVTRLLEELATVKRNTILFEGAQGALLDLDLGTYPYVTSSNTCLSAVGTSLGFSPRRIHEVIGVVKAYSTRVGQGPFPSEAPPEIAQHLRERGGEFGATTGRPRRCGWLDLVALRHALWANDVDTLALTKLDVLDELPEIKVAVAYRTPDGREEGFPASFNGAPLTVEWKTFPGWQSSTTGCRSFEELPPACRAYVSWISNATGRPLRMLSVGGERDRIIRFDPPFMPDPGV